MSTPRTTLEKTDRAVDPAILERRVDGIGIAHHATLGSVLSDPATSEATRLLVFLRHFG